MRNTTRGGNRISTRGSRLSSLLCLVGTLCGVWQMGRWTGRREAEHFQLLDDAERHLRLPGDIETGDLRELDALSPAVDHDRGGVVVEATGRLHADRFWAAYATDRSTMMTKQSPKYLVFQPTNAGLGNHMSGMMSAFVLSVGIGRVFLHEWNRGSHECAASYDDLFVTPFEPWSTLATQGSQMSGPGEILGDEPWGQLEGAGGTWDGSFHLSSPTERQRCSLDLTQAGVASGSLGMVFLEKRGEDPRPDCPVLFVATNQYLVEILSNAAYGSAKVGGILVSEWLKAGRAAEILFGGLFRPVAPVRRQLEVTAARVFEPGVRTLGAHARAVHLNGTPMRQGFVECLERWAHASNASTVVLASDIPAFVKDTAAQLEPHGITVAAMEGVQRTGEGAQMRDTVGKIRTALAELLLVGKADIVVTSPKSSFSALAAALGGESTQRVGGMSCKALINEPEFHLIDCGMKWELDSAKWSSVYPFVKGLRERCKS